MVVLFGWLIDDDTARRGGCAVAQQWNWRGGGRWKKTNGASAKQLIKDTHEALKVSTKKGRILLERKAG